MVMFGNVQAVNELNLGMRLFKPSAAVANWWDPNNEGFSAAGAYRAKNSIGTVWGGGPTTYAASRVNQANPGMNDLIEGNGAVPWAQATGWGFAVAAAQWFDTGLIPAADQSSTVLCQFSNVVAGFFLFGMYQTNALTERFLIEPSQGPGLRVRYWNGGTVVVAPSLLTGNLGFADGQGYRNGVTDGAPMAAWTAVPTFSIYIGGVNRFGAFFAPITADIEAIAIYSAPALTGPQMLAVATAMAAL
jgi:hypothetical protein